MRDTAWIAAGVLVFLGALASPFWYRRPTGAPAVSERRFPAGEKECVASAAYMRTRHAILLNQWREQAVRQNNRVFTAASGRSYRISLTGTCLLQCHRDKAQFCDRCHADNGVPDPSCWDCHLAPQPIQAPDQANGGAGAQHENR